MPADRFFDVRYDELVRDPIGVRPPHLRRTTGWRSRRSPRSACAGSSARHPKDKHGRHRYTLAEFGLDRDEEAERYRSYRERFGL